MSSPINDRAGQRFGKLVVVQLADPYISPSGKKGTCWLCRCDCGRNKICRTSGLTGGDYTSCTECRPSAEERFWSYVDKRGENDCWLWTGALNSDGYGNFMHEGKSAKAHRFSLGLAIGGIPLRLHALHKCDVPACVNPGHLYAGTHRQNMRDANDRNRIKRRSGPTHPDAKFSWEQVRRIRQEYSGGQISQDKLAAKYGVAQGAMSRIVRGLSYREPRS